jgi:drug/metabolite transporter (DMT)-like permease
MFAMTSGRAIAAILASAALFGASTPLARALVGDVSSIWLAGLLYAGPGVGLALVLAIQRWRGVARPRMDRADVRWLAGAIAFGGIVAPLFFTSGLARTGGATASLLLNLEPVFTVALAWFAFGEHRSARVIAGMASVVVACVVLAWPRAVDGSTSITGAALIALACLGWAIDNNFTRRISGNDATTIAAAKGLVGGAANIALAIATGAARPLPVAAIESAVVGFFGYGLSLVLFVVALRDLGAARASAYFGIAPFVGVVVAFIVLAEAPDSRFWIALPLMALGVWLHLTERHGHRHAHERGTHTHPHRHDEHHRHDHDFAWDGQEPHVHPHTHEPLVHEHRHTPDLHHGHRH